jgi:peptidoglycan hydrolase CwlO-like protein
VRSAEQRAADALATAELRADEAALEAQSSRASAQANLDQVTAEIRRLRSEIDELEHERRVIREQFINTQVYLQGLVALIEPTPNAPRERS